MADTKGGPPLNGLRVVEVGVAMAGPFCGMMLADYGADVVKIERSDYGDESRKWPPHFSGDDVSYYFAGANRNKRSLAIDLKSERGRDLVFRLACESDVLIDNFRVGALEELGLGYEDLQAKNPGLIYCSISGFGRDGPRRFDRANDIFMQAFSGGMSLTGYPDSPPAKMGISVADIGAGMFGTIGILMALEARHRTGRGQRVDTSLLEGQIAMLSNHVTYLYAAKKPPQRRGASGQVNVPYQAFKASDDWLVIAAFTDRMWQGVCRGLNHPEWGDDPRFARAADRIQNGKIVIGLMSDIIVTKPAKYWVERLVAEGVPCAPVNTIDQVVENEQVHAREMIVEMQDARGQTLRMPGRPIKFSESKSGEWSAPPMLGQHNREILRVLGLSDPDIAALENEGVLGGARMQAGLRQS